MPLDDQTLVVEPRYPNAELLSAIAPEPDGAVPDDVTVRNVFYSWRWKCDIAIWDDDGRIQWGRIPKVHHLSNDLQTLGCADAWGIEQESRALQTLGTLVAHRQFKQYLLTGMFLESSARSGVVYLFRRLKPTVALTMNKGKNIEVLCALCLHPIAYYRDSWAGAMCPTDDVIAHLMLMRGDEVMFWRRASQHPAYRPEAGL